MLHKHSQPFLYSTLQMINPTKFNKILKNQTALEEKKKKMSKKNSCKIKYTT